jgi:hypothetical protein
MLRTTNKRLPNEPNLTHYRTSDLLARLPGIGYLHNHMSQRTRRAVGCAGVLLFPLWVLGCSSRMTAPTGAPSGDLAPVALRNFEVTAADGHRAVLLRLTRIPTQVRHSSASQPARITVQAWGPPGDSDLPERDLPQLDAQISDVRVSRKSGELNVVIDLKGDEPPAYTVHEMADWIMIRFPGPAS